MNRVTVILPRRRQPLVGVGVVLALIIGISAPVSARTPRPKLTVASPASPVVLGVHGGQVTLVTTVKNATTCSLAAAPAIKGIGGAVHCQPGTARRTIAVPANPTSKVKVYIITFTVSGAGTTIKRLVIVKVQSAPALHT